MAGGHRFLEHMTDAVVEAYGDTLEEAFVHAARGLVDTMVDIGTVRAVEEKRIDAQGHDLESLLFDWLDKVMLLLVADGFATSQFSVQVAKAGEGYLLSGAGRGEKLDLSRHTYKVEIKAVTYHEMMVRQEEGKVTVRYLLDL
jgi:SHS2 domain-containing protein